ncbi:MAG TPA: RIP metalloprotease RseP [Candidatus Dormibacteraeota bacterium]|nr:RIP metalloprotease RseP [Candidatus Dormibacteraeota bacterium]
MQIIKYVFIFLEVLLLFNLLIFVHELGHFLAARWRGLKIDRFAIWFGKPIWKTKINGVEYALGTIPAGGYVSLPQMATMETIEGKSETPGEALPPISPLDKIIVAFAGPLFSFLLALAFAVVVMVVGRPVSEAETTTIIGYVEKDSPAEKAGLKPGDKILEVDGERVTKFGGMGDSVTWRIVRSEGDIVPIKVERDGKVLEFKPAPTKDDTKFWQRKSLRQIKIGPAESAVVAKVAPDGPAAAAGLQPGDQILEINGNKLYSPAGVGEYIEGHPSEKLNLNIMRSGRCFEVSLTPEKPVSPPDEKPRLGIVWDGNGKMTLTHPGAIEQVNASVNAMIETFGALFARHSDIKPQHLGGAVKIMDVYARLFSSEQGWRLALWFSVLMNVNLAVLNMLPIPVLDGGHILLALIEGIRRRPLSGRIVSVVQTGCAAALIMFMLYIAFYDVQDLPWKRGKEKPVEMKFAPKTPGKN